jgi:hypothetical protein
MSIAEPGFPHFSEPRPERDKPFAGARPTTAGFYRMFSATTNSPHEPWCMHFEWGPCTCGPRDGEVFVDSGGAE